MPAARLTLPAIAPAPAKPDSRGARASLPPSAAAGRQGQAQPWEKTFGALRDLGQENRRILGEINRAFRQVNPNEW